ncbi:MAG: [FeFe] hydrogenase H-cluster radical SAM maturase HydE [Syntrophaceae bacterium]|nr:[FeFe] hydrogenase H-cluster radical SAM maturase HydE [Syntrophaceae bacterium]
MEKNEIAVFLKDPCRDVEVFKLADKVRRFWCGEEVYLRGIIEFSNHCCRNCVYCGLRRDNTELDRFRMAPEEIVNLAGKIAGLGIGTIVLQSGDDFAYDRLTLCRVIENIKKKNNGLAVTLSVGERPFDDYRAFRDAGADRYLLKHETASPELYARLHPGQSLKIRLDILRLLRNLGYQTGAGNIVGLPGQTVEDLCADVLLLRDLEPDMASVGPFIPQRSTPLARETPGSLEAALRVLALVRIVTRNAHMPANTAVASLDEASGLERGLQAGANVIMPDFTPEYFRGRYTIYDGKTHITPERARAAIIHEGRLVGTGKGDSLHLGFSLTTMGYDVETLR